MKSHCRKHLQEVLEKNHSCYVLITCDAPSLDGKMDVKMTFQGDATLASYLLEEAQTYLEEEEENCREDFPSPIAYLN